MILGTGFTQLRNDDAHNKDLSVSRTLSRSFVLNQLHGVRLMDL